MTGRCWAFVLAILTIGVVALSIGTQLYYMLLLALTAMLVIGFLSCLIALVSLRVEIRCPKRSIVRGDNAHILVGTRHMSILPIKAIRINLSIPDDAGQLDAIEVNPLPFRREVHDVEMPCPHRGVYAIGVTGAEVVDAFDLFRLKRKSIGQSFTVEVRPKSRRIEPMRLSAGEDVASRMPRMTEDYASPADVRTWQNGDALKKVHWKLSMRKRELMVRTYEESARPDTLILTDVHPVSALKSHRLTIEDAITETAATIARTQLAVGYPVRMPLFSQTPVDISGESEGEYPKFAQALTNVRFDSPYAFDNVLQLEMRRTQRTGGAVLITPALTMRVADLATHLFRSGLSVTLCWVTDSRRKEALALLSQLSQIGLQTYTIDPWGEGLTEHMSVGRARYV